MFTHKSSNASVIIIFFCTMQQQKVSVEFFAKSPFQQNWQCIESNNVPSSVALNLLASSKVFAVLENSRGRQKEIYIIV